MPSLAALKASPKNAVHDVETASSPQPAPLCSRLLYNQSTYAQTAKLLFLCGCALAHVFYICDFLSVFAAFDVHSARALQAVPPSDPLAGQVRHLMLLLLDYKKNMWMSVGAMCVSLSTTCFLLHLHTGRLPAKSYYLSIARVVDLIAFVVVPVLLAARVVLSSRIQEQLPSALEAAASLHSPHDFINELHCTTVPREKLALCSEVMTKAIFPVVLLEYLLVLGILTLAYIGLAYLIEWCIRHFFPPNRGYMAGHEVLVSP